MSEYTREQLYTALRNADAAGDTEAARAIARRIASMDEASGEGLDISSTPITDTRPYTMADAATDVPQVMASSTAKAITSPLDLAMEVGGGVQQAITGGLTTGISGGLEMLGFDDTANAVRAGGEMRQEDIGRQTQQLQFRNALEQVAPTPQGFENSAMGTELVAGMAIPFKTARVPGGVVPKAAQPASEAQLIVNEGAKRNVPVMTTDVKPPRSAPGRFIKQTIPEKIPLAGTSGPRLKQQEARQEAVRQIVEEFGGDTGRALFDDSETAAQEVSRLLTKQRGERLGRLTSAKDSVIRGTQEPFSNAPNTVRAIAEEVRRLKGIDAEEYAPVIERLQRFGQQLTSGKSLEQVEGQRRLLGDMFQDTNLAKLKGDGQKAVNRIYGPLKEDMGNFIERTQGTAARAKWAKANDELSAMAGELKSSRFKNVLRDSDTTPETVRRILFAGAEDTSDMQRLVSNLDDAGKRRVQAALMTRAWEKAGGSDGVSVERFLGNLKTLSGKIGVAFKGEDRAALEGVRRLLEATRRGAEAGANVRTGEQNVPTILGIGATQALGFAGGVSTLGVGGLVARIYESAPVRNLLLGLSKTKPGSPAERKTLDRIMKAASPIVNNWQDDMARVANDNIAVPAAASGDERQTENQ